MESCSHFPIFYRFLSHSLLFGEELLSRLGPHETKRRDQCNESYETKTAKLDYEMFILLVYLLQILNK